jgi:hypothetical protein
MTVKKSEFDSLQGQDYFFSPRYSHRLWGPLRLLSSEYGVKRLLYQCLGYEHERYIGLHGMMLNLSEKERKPPPLSCMEKFWCVSLWMLDLWYIIIIMVFLPMVYSYKTKNQWVFGLCPSSSILKIIPDYEQNPNTL